jgi:hypothetical protein
MIESFVISNNTVYNADNDDHENNDHDLGANKASVRAKILPAPRNAKTYIITLPKHAQEMAQKKQNPERKKFTMIIIIIMCQISAQCMMNQH